MCGSPVVHASVPEVCRQRVVESGPETKIFPFGASCIIGYKGTLSVAFVNDRQPPPEFVCQTSGVFTPPPGSAPESTAISPFPTVTALGYQRPADIGRFVWVHVLLL